jgi:hypothetical protein
MKRIWWKEYVDLLGGIILVFSIMLIVAAIPVLVTSVISKFAN